MVVVAGVAEGSVGLGSTRMGAEAHLAGRSLSAAAAGEGVAILAPMSTPHLDVVDALLFPSLYLSLPSELEGRSSSPLVPRDPTRS
jgi:hypothetical protein